MNDIEAANILHLFTEKLYKVAEMDAADTGLTINKQFDVVVLYDGEADQLPNEEKNLLTNILKAIGLSIKKVNLLNINNLKGIGFSQLRKAYGQTRIIGFGISPTQLNLQIQTALYQKVEMMGCQLLFANTLLEISKDTSKKKLLWGSLKAMFSV